MEENKLFPSTQWTALYLAAHGDEAERERNRGALADLYRKPVKKVAGWLSWLNGDSEDAVEQVLARMVAPDALVRVDRTKGKFRAFVAGIIHHLWQEHWRNAHRQCRDVRVTDSLEKSNAAPAVLEHSIQEFLDREVAMECVEKTREFLLNANRSSNRLDVLWRVMMGQDLRSRREVAEELGTSANAVSRALIELRNEFKETFLRVVRAGVADPADVEAEGLYLWRIAREALTMSAH